MQFKRLKDMREDCDMSQEEVAKILKIQQVQYSRYERGEREIPIRHMIKLAEYYNVSMDYLCGIKKAPTPLHKYRT